jgi:ribosomal protein S27E
VVSEREEVLQPALDQNVDEGTYTVQVKCENCGHRQEVVFDRGERVGAITVPCENCGCAELVRARQP